MIFITGDTHGEHDIMKLAPRWFPQQEKMTKDDYIIVAGDFGSVWLGSPGDDDQLEWYRERPFTTLFVDGNHENHEILDNLPVTEWNGGKVHVVNDSVIHLMRGQVYTIDGKKFFTFGGADSIDKAGRIRGISWWERELPSVAECEEGFTNLEAHGNKVDYIITHTCPASVFPHVRNVMDKEITALEKYFDIVKNQTEFRYWFFGHYHRDAIVLRKFHALYHGMARVR